VNARTAQILGGVAGALAVAGWLVARRVGPPPCTGGVFVELAPPLSLPGLYRFELDLDGERTCAFVVPVPTDRVVDTSSCQLELELSTRSEDGKEGIVGLAIGAAPERLGLRIRHGEELAFDALVTPTYSEYPMPRSEGRAFCGERATVRPACVRGSMQCAPFAAACDGPEDCSSGQICCVSADWAREHGARAATACLTERRCLERYADVACHAPGDCPRGARCDPAALRGEFRPELAVCRGCASR
jgi:hypothetical protein